MFVSVSLYGLCSLPFGVRLTRSIGELLASPCAGGTPPQASPKLGTAVSSANAAMTFMNYSLLITCATALTRYSTMASWYYQLRITATNRPSFGVGLCPRRSCIRPVGYVRDEMKGWRPRGWGFPFAADCFGSIRQLRLQYAHGIANYFRVRPLVDR